jgi:hypothetical protein
VKTIILESSAASVAMKRRTRRLTDDKMQQVGLFCEAHREGD